MSMKIFPDMELAVATVVMLNAITSTDECPPDYTEDQDPDKYVADHVLRITARKEIVPEPSRWLMEYGYPNLRADERLCMDWLKVRFADAEKEPRADFIFNNVVIFVRERSIIYMLAHLASAVTAEALLWI